MNKSLKFILLQKEAPRQKKNEIQSNYNMNEINCNEVKEKKCNSILIYKEKLNIVNMKQKTKNNSIRLIFNTIFHLVNKSQLL